MEERNEVLENLEVMADSETDDTAVRKVHSAPKGLILVGATLGLGVIAIGKFAVDKIKDHRRKKASNAESEAEKNVQNNLKAHEADDVVVLFDEEE